MRSLEFDKEMSALRLRHLTALILVLSVFVTGCIDGRPKRVTVAGKVTVDGAPLTKGNVIFVPEGGRPSSGKVQQDGRFVLRCFEDDDGALVGRHRVAVTAKDIISETNIVWHAPPRFSGYQSSGLEVEITESVDDLHIELFSDPTSEGVVRKPE